MYTFLINEKIVYVLMRLKIKDFEMEIFINECNAIFVKE